jgi:hypothetical protein
LRFLIDSVSKNKNIKSALIGLIVLFALSFSLARGGKPRIEKVTSTMRPLSGKETNELIDRIPEIFTDALGAAATGLKTDEIREIKRDTLFLKSNLRISELTNSLLQGVFSKAHLYQLWKLESQPHTPYLIAIIGDKDYHMPSSFNRLLLEHNLEVNNKNIVKLAEAFVIIAFEGQEITFLEGKKIKEYDKEWYVNWSVQIKCIIGDTKDIQTWKFSLSTVRKGQFSGVDVFVNNNRLRNYQLKTLER